MADIYKTEVELKFKVPKGETDRINRVIQSALSPSIMGKVKGMAPMMGGMKGMAGMGALGAAAGGAAAIVMSSPSLQNTLKHLVKTVMLLIRPIGDIIAIGLRPLIDIMRPIGIFFRTLIRPYLKKAMDAMRLGRGFLAKGEYGKAAESYALGASFLLKPIFDMMVTVSAISIQGILAGIKVLGQALISIVPFTEDVNMAFGEMMDETILNVGTGGARIIRDTEIMMTEWLATLKTEYKNLEVATDTHTTTMSTLAGEGFIRMIQGATAFWITSETVKSEVETMFDDIVIYGEKKINELNSLMEKKPSRSWSSTSHIMTSSGGMSIAEHLTKPGDVWNFNIDFKTGENINLVDYANKIAEAIGYEVRK